ncbi:MAG: Na+:solute symporter [Pirellulaceae bacterium]|nr:Na+:solute symporter [Pirellulaceae bacterium]
MTLTALDYLIIVAYVLATLAIGIGFSRRAGKSLNEFFISGRSLPWWIAGTSMVATTFAADTPLAVTGIVIKDGLAGNWIWWAFAVGGMITVFVYAKLWRRSEVVTDVEFVELRYGGKPAAALRGVRAVYVALLVNAIIIGWVCGAMITFFEATIFSGAVESTSRQWWLLIGCLAVVGLYATLSGMWGVAFADVMQFILAMIGCVLLAWIAVKHVGGVDALREKVTAQFDGGEQALHFLPDFSGENAWMPLYAFTIIALMQWWATWYPGAEPGGGGYVVQRMASCKNERHSLLATLWFQIAHYCLRPWPWIMVAFAALAMYPELRSNYVADSGFDPGVGYPMAITDLAPSGLRGLMLVTFFAAFMSTISTQMNWGASYLVKDVYQRFIKPEASDKHYANASRVASVIVLIAGGIATWSMKDFSIDAIWNILLALGAGTGLVFMLRWFWWRINAWTEIVAMLASLVFFLLIGVGKKSSWLEIVVVERAQVKIMLVAFASIVCWLIATFLTKPESMEKLTSFYTKIHPGGPGWKPVAKQCPGVVADSDLGISLFAAVIASILIYSVLPMTGFIIFGEYQSALIAGSVALVCGLITLKLVRRLAR